VAESLDKFINKFIGTLEKDLFKDIDKLREDMDDLKIHQESFKEHDFEAETFGDLCRHCNYGFFAIWHPGGWASSSDRKTTRYVTSHIKEDEDKEEDAKEESSGGISSIFSDNPDARVDDD
jgi:hypothetical protein